MFHAEKVAENFKKRSGFADIVRGAAQTLERTIIGQSANSKLPEDAKARLAKGKINVERVLTVLRTEMIRRNEGEK